MPAPRLRLAVALTLATAAVAGCAVSTPTAAPRAGDSTTTVPSPGEASGSPTYDADLGDRAGGRGAARPISPAPDGTSGAPLVLPGRPQPDDYQRPRRKPNILLVTADDAALGDLKHMPHVRKLIGDQGTTFTQAVAPTPICVPARASLLTGQYAHNHGALTIDGEGGGFDAFRDGRTLPVWLERAGYDTLFVGKYLNGYGERRSQRAYVPPGWSDWRGSLDPATYNFAQATQNVNGRVRVRQEYSTDAFADDVNAMLRDPARKKDPFYLWVNYVAPHAGGPRQPDDPRSTHPGYDQAPQTTSPAPKYRNRFSGLPLPRKPNMFESDLRDKPRISPARQRTYSRLDKRLAREVYQQRLEALQSVDDAVASHVRVLRRQGLLKNTIVVFTSDNGYVVGEHNFEGKLWHYRETSGIPVLMRGPGIPRDRVSPLMVTNPDLPVSFAAVAGARALRKVDGVNLFAHLGRRPGARVVPLEAYPVQGGTRPVYTGIRVGPWTYATFRNGAEEAYDHRIDPYEIDSVAKDPAYRRQMTELRRLERQYRHCAAASCPQTFYR